MIAGTDIAEIREALLDAFDADELAEMLRIRLNVRFNGIVAPGPDGTRVFRLIEWSDRHGRLLDLLQAVYLERPDNGKIRQLYEKVGFSTAVHVQKSGTTVAGAPNFATSAALEATVRPNLPFLDLAVWREKLSRIEGQVCRIDFDGRPSGTGFLIGADLVLTNYHVIEPALDGRIAMASVTCRFDYKVLIDGSRLDGVVVNVAAVLDSSKYSRAEGDNDPDRELPRSDQLDHALLKLERAIGSDPVGRGPAGMAPPRGWVQFPRQQPPLAPGAPLIIAQHPDGSPIKLALDTNAVLKINDNGTRIRYATNTEPGSSGSPCFDLAWNLVALHHMGDPTWLMPARYNEGIPIGIIGARLVGQGLVAAPA